MLHILLTILKVIGLILLIIAGILLFLVLSVLFVPLRYHGRFSYKDKAAGCLQVTWLLHILSLRLQYDESLTAVFRVIGIPVRRKDFFAEMKAEEAGEDRAEGLPPDDESGRQRDADTKETAAERGKSDTAGTAADTITQPAKAANHAAKTMPTGKVPPEPAHSRNRRAGRPEPGKPLMDRIKSRFRKFLKKMRFSFARFCDKLKEIADRKERFFAFIQDEENKKTYTLVIRLLKKLFRHLRPGLFKGRIAFGFDDPYTTGQVLMAASPFLGWYYKTLSLEPYFDREILEADVRIRGRVRIGTVLRYGLLVYRDRNFRKLLRFFRD